MGQIWFPLTDDIRVGLHWGCSQSLYLFDMILDAGTGIQRTTLLVYIVGRRHRAVQIERKLDGWRKQRKREDSRLVERRRTTWGDMNTIRRNSFEGR